MTNLEKVLQVDGDRFLQEISEKICFCTFKHTVKVVQPPLCGNCEFGECISPSRGKWKCHTKDIVAWLKEECEEDDEDGSNNT